MVKFYALILGTIAYLTFTSCSTHKNSLPYFTDIEEVQLLDLADYHIKVEPGDELLITVNSTIPEATIDYNIPLVNSATLSNAMSTGVQPRLQTYVVDKDGDINFPTLGLIHVAGQTLVQIRDYLTSRIQKEVKDAVVKVQLVNFGVNVIGEVKSPRRVGTSNERLSVVDAITQAGDLTSYGKRSNVLVIREENGKRTMARLNLNSAESLNSPYYFLKQNDIVYVEPTQVREDSADYDVNRGFKLQIASTIVSGVSVIVSLLIALLVK